MVPLFTAAIFVAAFLLFLIQPLAARLVLPQLGGSSAVWTGTMMFFQVLLLGGYAYAHALGALKPRIQGVIHATIMLACIVFLPLALPAWWTPGSIHPLASLLLALIGSVGLPFFAISASSPLLQAWFARTGHRRAHDPYFLYAASNAGSLLGLLSYPFLVEPALGLHAQGWAWAVGFALCALLLGGCWALTRGSRSAPSDPAAAPLVDPSAVRANQRPVTRHAKHAPSITSQTKRSGAAASHSNRPADATTPTEHVPSESGLWTQRACWIALAAAPSSLSLGVTQYLCTDVAAIPLLWVIPLALYLLTYIVAFSRFGPLGERLGRLLLPIVTVSVSAAIMLQAVRPLAVVGLLHLAVLLAAGLACHGRLAALRPKASRLTEFYLLASLGGALGGAFNALVAPLVFHVVLEYPLAIAACSALLVLGASPASPANKRSLLAWLLPPLANLKAPARLQGLRVRLAQQPRIMQLLWPVLAVLLVALYLIGADTVLAIMGFDAGRSIDGVIPGRSIVLAATVGVPLVLAFLVSRWPLVFAAMIATLAGQATLFPFAGPRLQYEIAYGERSFFGVCMVLDRPPFQVQDGPIVPVLRTLRHGTTAHGQQFLDETKRHDPLSYYSRSGPVGRTFAALPDAPRTVGMIGLGAGSVAAYARSGDQFDYFEIDPAIVHIARDSGLFTYLADSPAQNRVIVGDGRLKIAEQPEGRYDLLILDAFSSDSIPVHLLTREAFEIYRARLKPGGVLLVHISNLHFDLLPPVARAADDLHMLALHLSHAVTPQDSYVTGVLPSSWMALSPDPGTIEAMVRRREGWERIPRPDDKPAWTDDHANVLSAMTFD